MGTTTWVYEVVKWPVTKTFKACAVCGRPGKRSKTFRQTINPFNKNAEGKYKIRPEIIAELKVQAESWQATMHAGCE